MGGQDAYVTHVIDGDTIEVTINGAPFTVQYAGIDAPEAGECYAAQATRANAGLVQGQWVTLEKDTNDLDRPFSSAAFAGDVLGVLDHLGLNCVDVFGFSVGGAVALELAVRRPERVRRLIASSVSFRASGMRGSENAQAVGEMKVEMIAGTPMEAAYLAKSPHPDHEHLQGLLDKLGAGEN